MRKSGTDEVQGEHTSWSFIYRCEKEEVRWKRINKDLVLCQRCYGESRVIACSQTREAEEWNMIRDGTKVEVFGKVGYKERWRLEMELGVS
jgi:hypothetical protein